MAIRIHVLGRLLSRQAGLILLMMLACIPLLAVTQISLDSQTGVNGREVLVNLSVSELPLVEVYSFYAKLSFDQSALELREVRRGSAMPESWSDPVASNPPLQSIAAYGTTALSSPGVLLQLRFGLIGTFEHTYPISINYFSFNEQEYNSNLVHGAINTLNRIPTLQGINPVVAYENQPLSFELVGSDPRDLLLAISALNPPSGSGLSISGFNRANFTWTPSYTQAGNYELLFGVHNLEGFGDTLLVQVEVNQQISVHIPFGTCFPGEYIDIPIYGQDFSGMEVYSVFSRIQYDPALLVFDSIVQAQSLSQSWPAAVTTNTDSQVNISLYGTAPLAGSGPIFYLRMQAIGELYSRANLHFSQFILNEGNPPAQVNDGFIFLGGPEPWFDPINDLSINEGELWQLNLQAHDPQDLPMQLEALSIPPGASFGFDDQNQITITWQTGFFDFGTYSVTLRATNAGDLSTEISFDLQVLNVPVAPIVVNPIAQISFAEDTVYSALDLADVFDDGDIQVGDILSYSVGPNQWLSVAWNGSAVSITPAPDWYGNTQLCFTATDLALNSINHCIDVQVLPVNDPPRLISSIPPITMLEDSPGIQIDLSEHLYDVESDLLGFSVSGANNLQIGFNGFLMTIVPDPDWYGVRDCILVAQELNTIEQYALELPFRVEVLPVNDAPVILQNLPNVTMMHNANHISEPLDLYFADVDSPLSYQLSGTQNIIAELIAGNRISLTPLADWYGTEYLSVTAVDDSLASVEQSFRISVIRDFYIAEDFNQGGALPTGWMVNTVSGSSNWTPVLESGTDYAMQVQNPTASTINAYRLMSPAYNLSQYKDITVSFDYNLQGVNTAIFQYSTTGITWTTVASLASNTSGTAEYLIPALQQQANIRFRWSYQTNSLLSNSWKIDDFQISGLFGDFVRPSTIQNLEIVSQTTSSVSLAWTPCEEEYFERYEIFYSTDSVINTQDPVWSVSSDPNLAFLATNSTTITGLSIDTAYWFMIRGVDSSANMGLPSNTPDTFLNQLPVLHSPYPEAGIHHNSRNVTIGISAEDDIMLWAASIEYRADLNGNGIYDEDEVWTPVPGYSDATQLEIRIPVSFGTDGDNLRYEFRVKDIPGVQYVYSGSESLAGIEDDYGVLIDTIAPTQIEDLTTSSATGTSVTLAWSPAYDLHFAGYEVYYASSPVVDETASVWTLSQDPTLADMASSGTQITGLISDTRYWFRIAARDLAGNLAPLSNQVTNIANSEIPVFHDPLPEQGTGFSNSRTVQIGTWIYDAYGIDHSRIHYRYDANGNGVYDPEESWAQAQSIQRSREEGSIFVTANVTFESDGNALAYEFRAWDIDNYGPAYSGTNGLMGIEDDWTLAIDTIAPAVVQNLLAGAQSQSSIQLAFSASSDLNFDRYEVYYSTSPDVGLANQAWTPADDPSLGQMGSGTIVTTITDLAISTRYYFRVRAVDLAGNASWSSEVSVSTMGAFPPATPQNFRLEISGNDVILSWDPVTTNSNGDPMEVAAYLIYGSTDPFFEADFGSLLDVTQDSFYVFEDIAAFIPYVFFRVKALDQFDDRQAFRTGKGRGLQIDRR